jgi:hypothetical protein
MKFSEYLKRIFVIYFIVVTCITAVTGITGLIFFPEARFGYEAFFSPLVCGLVSMIPSLLLYSKKELTFRQALVRKVLHYVLIILLLLLLNSLANSWNWSFFLPLLVSIIIVCILVELILWIIDYKRAEELGQYLRVYQNKNR